LIESCLCLRVKR